MKSFVPMKNKAVLAELQRIAAEHGGLLRPSDVVKAARAKTSPLHSRFTWDDTKAAQEWRLHEARNLIRVMVHILPNGSDEPQRVFVSLNRDTESEGYRPLISVMSDKQLREALLQQAMAEMDYFTEKYESLKELSNVFSAMRRTKARLTTSELKKAA